MPIEITMPALSPTMTEGNLAKWHKKEGDTVDPGEVIAEIETDKATMEVEAVDEGVLGKILVPSGTKGVKVNAVIGLLLADGEDKKALKSYKPKVSDDRSSDSSDDTSSKGKKKTPNNASSASSAPAGAQIAVGFTSPPDVPIVATNVQKKATQGAALAISPVAKRLAQEAGLNYTRLVGTGPKGRIIKEDVDEALRTGMTSGRGGRIMRDPVEQVAIENNNMRQVIANRLLQSKQHIPHFYLTIECRLDKLLELRKDLNDAAPQIDGKPAYKLSVNDMVIKAVALGMNEHPAVNASWTNDAIIQYNNVDVSVAVAIDGGLMTPIIRNADQKSLQHISQEMKDLARRARTGDLVPEEFQGGGFSISNLGMFGIKEFKAIINPPQSCILAVGAGEQRPIVTDGELEIATMVTVSLSCDHRAVDGAVGAQFLASFKQAIEIPIQMVI